MIFWVNGHTNRLINRNADRQTFLRKDNETDRHTDKQEILAKSDNENGIMRALLKSAKKVQIEAFGQVVV